MKKLLVLPLMMVGFAAIIDNGAWASDAPLEKDDLDSCPRVHKLDFEQNEDREFNVIFPEHLKIIMHMLIEGKNPEDVLEHLGNSGNFDLSQLSKTTTLNLQDYNENITDDILKKIVKLFPSLTTLNLEWCIQITDEGVAYVASLTDLKSLNLHGCYQITNNGLTYLASLADLQALDLYGCHQIDGKGLLHLSSLKNLYYVDASGTEVSCRDVRNLKNYIPHININLYH